MSHVPLRIQLLGGFAVSLAGRPVPSEAWRLRKAKSLIKLLALANGHRVLRSEIGELLWPERAPASVQNNCAQALHVARRALEACGADGDAIASTSGGLLALREPVDVDLDMFAAAAAGAAELRTVEMVRAALDLYAGRAFARGSVRVLDGRAPRGRARAAPAPPDAPRRAPRRRRRAGGGDRGARASRGRRSAPRGRPPGVDADLHRMWPPSARARPVPAPASATAA
jgi:hypothetical protein